MPLKLSRTPQKNTLYIVSAYMSEKGGNPSPSVHAEALRGTSETAATSDSYLHTEGDPSVSNVALRAQNVNTKSETPRSCWLTMRPGSRARNLNR